MAVPSLANARESSAEPRRSKAARLATNIVEFGPALIILTLPLEFTARLTLQPVTRWVMVVVGAAFVYELATRSRHLVWPRSLSVVFLLTFIAFSIASWLVARPPASLKQLGDLAVYPVFALLMMNLVVTPGGHRRAWTAFLLSGVLVAACGLVLYITHTTIWTPNPVVAHRLNITFADPNITARFLTLTAAAAVVLFAARRSATWLCVAAAVLSAIVEPMTFSRSGLVLFMLTAGIAVVVAENRRRALGFAACMLVVFALSTTLNPDTRQRALDAEATAVSLVGGSSYGISAPAAAGGSDSSALADNRRYLIAAGLKMFADHPVLGVGFGAYQHNLVSTYRRFIPSEVPNPDTVSHTTLVTVAAEEGIAGLLLLIAFLFALAREAIASRRLVWAVVPATLVIPIFLYSQFEGRLIEEPYFWLCLALFYAAVRGRPRVTSPTM